MQHSQLIPLVALTLLLGACAWVQPEPGSSDIVLRTGSEVAGCERLGQTTVSVRDRVAGVQRSAAAIDEELTTLARNSAFELGGNAIVGEQRERAGKQRFGIYRCE